MGKLLSFIFESGIVMMTMYTVYKLLLAREKQHGYNRVVLLSIYFLAPAFTLLSHSIIRSTTGAAGLAEGITTADLVDLAMLNASDAAFGESAKTPAWIQVAIVLYVAGIVFFIIQTIMGQLRVSAIIRRCEKRREGRYRLCLSDDATVSPFSFGKTIVMNRDDLDSAGHLILIHEKRHLDCRHTLDLLIARAVIILNWFNPAAWLIAEELKSVHEYQADMAVLNSGADARQYQMLLIKRAVGQSFPAIANSLNHSNLKKRITMMQKSRQSKKRRLRAIALIPAAVAAMLVADIPAVASALNSVGNARLTSADTGKVSEKVENPTADAPEKNVGAATLPAGLPNVYVDDEKFEGDMSSIDPSRIKSIDIKKDGPEKDGAIYITLKHDGEAADNSDKIVDTAQQMPQFPGGEGEMLSYVMANLVYPEEAMNKGTEGMVIVKFVVNKDGSVSDVEALRSVDPQLDAEAIRVVSSLPDFQPGTINGEPVAVYYTMPVKFKLQKDKAPDQK